MREPVRTFEARRRSAEVAREDSVRTYFSDLRSVLKKPALSR
jgi:hypothetical protein